MTKPIRIRYQSFADEANGGAYWRRLAEHIAETADPGTTADIIGITPFDSYAHPIVEYRCGREVISNAIRAEREGYDAFVIGHFQDAGLYEARAAVDIPVVALGEASMLYACQLGQRIGIVTINPRFTPWFHHQIRKYGLEHRVTGVHAMDFQPGQLLMAFEDAAAAREAEAAFKAEAAPLIEKGIDVLIPGGGLSMLLFSGIRGHAIGGAPVLNGIPVVIKTAEMAVKLRRLNGLGVSRVSDFFKPPPEVIEEFLAHPKGL